MLKLSHTEQNLRSIYTRERLQGEKITLAANRHQPPHVAHSSVWRQYKIEALALTVRTIIRL
ncbi:hypothetical protein TU75_22205 [Pseudomonas poae]|nr:hypothetical protein TU75_22205 [Pseudomonas poae]